MAADRIWTVVRFPNGSWSYGGRPDSPDYEHCEVWRIPAESAQAAVKKAQAKRSRENRKRNAGVPAGRHCQSSPHPDKDVCRASQRDGVLCADGECDIDDGMRAADGVVTGGEGQQ